MVEKESPKRESKKKNEKTIVLSEWQKKNQAYLEKRAEEKAAKEAADRQKKAEQQAKIEALKRESEEQQRQSQSGGEKKVDEQNSEKEEPHKDTTENSSKSEADEASDIAETKKDTEQEEDQIKPDDSSKEGSVSEPPKLPTKTKAKPKRIPKSKKRDWTLFLKSFPVLSASLLLLLASLYFLSPFSRLKDISVTGNAQLKTEEILGATGIMEEDYTLTTFLNQSTYAKQIESTLLWIKSAKFNYRFPTAFEVAVEEYKIVGYVKDEGDFYPVLSSGSVINKPVTESEVVSSTLIFQLTDLEMIKTFVLTFEGLDSSLLSQIETVNFSPTAASSDLLTLNMRDGHTVLVPLTGLKEKMPYYSQIASALTTSSVIDMEAGIYSYAK